MKGTREERGGLGESHELPIKDVAGEGRGEAPIVPGDSEGGDVVLEGESRSVQEALVDVLVRGVVEEAPLRRGGPDGVAKVGGVTGKWSDHNLEAVVSGEAEVVGVGERSREG